MKKIFIILLNVLVICACSKEKGDNNINNLNYDEDLLGKWAYIRVASDPEFKHCIEDNSNESGFYYFEFRINNNFYFYHDNVYQFESKFQIEDNNLYITEGEFITWETGASAKKGEKIEIVQYQPNKIIMKWYYNEQWWGEEGYYYTEIRRLESIINN